LAFRTIVALITGALAVLTPTSIASAANNQLGDDIDGQVAFGQAGAAVALSADGSTLVIGTGSENTVRVYRWNGSDWVPRGAAIAGEAALDLFGYSVATSSSGDTIAVGAPDNGGGATRKGHVRVFDWNGVAWIQRGIDIDGGANNDRLGSSVALSANGNDLVAGATQDDVVAGGGAGYANAYRWSGGAWLPRGATISGQVADDAAGQSVDMSNDGDTIAVGAHLFGSGGGALGRGRVRVFTFVGGAWSQIGSNIDGEPDDQSGLAVSLSGDGSVVAIGAPLHNGAAGVDSGTTRVYTFNGGVWTQRGTDIDGDAAGNQSGRDVALSDDGNTVVIGAPWTGAQSGQVRVFTFASGSWAQRGTTISGRGPGLFGASVAVSGDGTIFASGAPTFTGPAGMFSGHVRVFQWVPPPAPSPPIVPIWRASLDPNGGTCVDDTARTATWTSAFIGYRYLPGPTDCTRPGYAFGGWANTSTPTIARTFPLLTDPSTNTQRYFVADNLDLVAVWKPLPTVVSDLVMFANFFCGPCTNAWLIHTPSEHATSYDYTLNSTPATCSPSVTVLGLHACQLTSLTAGTPLTATVTPRNNDRTGPSTTTTFTLRR
jgi:hypothetical protein